MLTRTRICFLVRPLVTLFLGSILSFCCFAQTDSNARPIRTTEYPATIGLGKTPNPTAESATSRGKADASVDESKILQARRKQVSESLLELEKTSINLANAHKDRNLTARQLATDTKTIHKKADVVRQFWRDGDKLPKVQLPANELKTPEAYEDAILTLSRLVARFLNNPVITEPRKLDLNQQKVAAYDLSAILTLSKMIEKNAPGYQPKTK